VKKQLAVATDLGHVQIHPLKLFNVQKNSDSKAEFAAAATRNKSLILAFVKGDTCAASMDLGDASLLACLVFTAAVEL
jgi:hypothetical protein